MKPYKTIYKEGSREFFIEKSRFIGYSKPVEKEEDALEFINKIKTINKDANHNVWAYILGEDQNIQRYSDDGEPSGTAGIPVLEVIKKENLTNLVVVVTRYFGGIKLGAGGLVRAYTKGCKVSISDGKISEKLIYTPVKIKVDYSMMGKIDNRLKEKNIKISDIEYDENVNFTAYVSIENQDELVSYLIELTNNQIEISLKEPIYIDSVDGDILIN